MRINFSTLRENQAYHKDIENIYNIVMDELEIKFNFSCNIVDIKPEEIKEMNNKYRGVDRVTDVLSFPMIENIKDIEKEDDYYLGECNIGDIYINPQRVKEQALEYGHSERREYCFLALHGLLHLLGYDHIKKDDEEKMFALQDKIMEKAKIGRN